MRGWKVAAKENTYIKLVKPLLFKENKKFTTYAIVRKMNMQMIWSFFKDVSRPCTSEIFKNYASGASSLLNGKVVTSAFG